MLLDLPNELLLEIIYCLDPGSFSQLFRVCKTLRSAALGALPLQNQLGKVPGINGSLGVKDVKKLYRAFRRRASRNLLHGVDALADISHFALPRSEQLKYGMFMNCSCKTDHLLMALVCTKDASVGMYSIKSQIPILKCVLSPTALGLGPEEDIEFEVVKTAFYDSHERSKICQCVAKLAVLYRYRLRNSVGGPFVKAAVKQSKEVMKLVTWAFTEAFDASVEEIRDINTGGSLEPRALAMADDGSALICYGIHPNGTMKSSGEWRIEWVQKKPNRFYDPFPLVRVCDTSCAASGTPAPAPSEICIIKNRAWFFAPGIPTPHWEIDDYTSVSSDHMSSTSISFSTKPFTAASFGFPLAVHHKHHLVDPFGDEYCLNSVLQLHIHNGGPHPGAYIVKGVHFPNGCQHYNPVQRYHSIEHIIVAELGSLNLESGTSSSLGLIMAVSPRKRRIAIATWKRVQIWVVHPNAFFERQTHTNGTLAGRSRGTSSNSSTETDLDSSDATLGTPQVSSTNPTNGSLVLDSSNTTTHVSAPSVSSTTTTASTDTSASNFSNDDFFDVDEWPWVERCGWDYYSCSPRRDITEPSISHHIPRSKPAGERTEIVSLQPVELPSHGVVFALAFNGEDSLWAWTERGPVRWTFDGNCDARREEYELGWQVKEMDVKS